MYAVVGWDCKSVLFIFTLELSLNFGRINLPAGSETFFLSGSPKVDRQLDVPKHLFASSRKILKRLTLLPTAAPLPCLSHPIPLRAAKRAARRVYKVSNGCAKM